MKKHGYTLAEILVTLAVVGIVSAVVLPTFVTQSSNAKIGPKLAKAVASFEQASKAVLNERNTDRLTDVFDSGGGLLHSRFWPAMANHLKGNINPDDHCRFKTKDGVTYRVDVIWCHFSEYPQVSRVPHQFLVCDQVKIDLDGAGVGANKDARDVFYFQLMNDGSLRPWGGSWETDANKWQTRCPKHQKPTGNNAKYCAGHILENGLKVEYN